MDWSKQPVNNKIASSRIRIRTGYRSANEADGTKCQFPPLSLVADAIDYGENDTSSI